MSTVHKQECTNVSWNEQSPRLQMFSATLSNAGAIINSAKPKNVYAEVSQNAIKFPACVSYNVSLICCPLRALSSKLYYLYTLK